MTILRPLTRSNSAQGAYYLFPNVEKTTAGLKDDIELAEQILESWVSVLP